MKILVTGTEGYIGARLAPLLHRRRPRRRRARHRLLPRRLSVPRSAGHAGRRRDDLQGSARRDARATSPASTPSSIWRSSRTIRSARTDPRSRSRSTTRARFASPRPRARRACGASSTRRRAASTAWGPASSSTRRRRPIRRPPTPSARCCVERDLLPHGRRRLLRRVPAQCHRLRTLAAHALRHRAQRPVRTGVDAARDRDDQRRQPVAADRAHRGHLRGHAVRRRGAGRRGQRRGLQRRREPPRTTAFARSPRSSPRPFRAAKSAPARRAGTTAATAFPFDKIESRLPGFRARWTALRGAEELRKLFERIELSPDTYEFRAFTRLKQLKYLQRTAQIDDDLFWRPR